MAQAAVVLEKCAETGLYVGHVPGVAGAHSQGETLQELKRNLRQVVGSLLDDGEFRPADEFDLRLAQQELILAQIEEFGASDRLDRSELHDRRMG